MFGLKIPNTTAYCGWRAILENGYVDIVHDRATVRGDEEDTDKLIKVVNKSGAWKRMIKWAGDQYGSSHDVFEEDLGNNMVLRASPQASYGYLYIGLAQLEKANE